MNARGGCEVKNQDDAWPIRLLVCVFVFVIVFVLVFVLYFVFVFVLCFVFVFVVLVRQKTKTVPPGRLVRGQ